MEKLSKKLCLALKEVANTACSDLNVWFENIKEDAAQVLMMTNAYLLLVTCSIIHILVGLNFLSQQKLTVKPAASKPAVIDLLTMA